MQRIQQVSNLIHECYVADFIHDDIVFSSFLLMSHSLVFYKSKKQATLDGRIQKSPYSTVAYIINVLHNIGKAGDQML